MLSNVKQIYLLLTNRSATYRVQLSLQIIQDTINSLIQIKLHPNRSSRLEGFR